MDRQTRELLGVKPWQTILVRRYLPPVLASELSNVALTLAAGVVGVAVSLPANYTTSYPWLPAAPIVSGLITAVFLTLVKLRSKL